VLHAVRPNVRSATGERRPRDDGSKQWAYKGATGYTWYRDNAPGQAEGDGFNGNR